MIRRLFSRYSKEEDTEDSASSSTPEEDSPQDALPENENEIETTNNTTPTATTTATTSSPTPPLKILFLSSDTGGGHRASAESLATQFLQQYPGSTYNLLDLVKDHGTPPYNNLENWYSHLSQNPSQWNMVYKVSNSKTFEAMLNIHLKLVTERATRRRIQSFDADVVISVHPLMTNVPVVSCAKISAETGVHLPMFTVVTDLGSGHCTWFDKGVEKMFIASEQIRKLAMERGQVPQEKLVKSGLPIRQDFAIQAENLSSNGRYSNVGLLYQYYMRRHLGIIADNDDEKEKEDAHTDGDITIDQDVTTSTTTTTNTTTPTLNHQQQQSSESSESTKVILLMGGGEGNGKLSSMVNSIYAECKRRGISTVILVICGRNQELYHSIQGRDWDLVWKEQEDKFKSVVLQIENDGCGSGSGSSISGVSSGLNQIVMNHLNPLRLLGKKRRKDSATTTTSTTTTTTTTTATSSANHDDNNDDDIGCGSCIDLSNHPTSSSSILMDDMKLSKSISNDDDDNNDVESEENNVEVKLSSSSEEGEGRGGVNGKNVISSSVVNKNTHVQVQPLGFVSNMAEYMVAADILISKAGPGTIAEAAALGLPILLTSHLPGQEEGNVDFVVEKKFGRYVSDGDPGQVSQVACEWLEDLQLLRQMSDCAMDAGCPHAAEEIVKCIGESVVRWKELNEAG